MTSDYWLFLVILISTIFFSVRKGKLTPTGAIAGGIIGCFIYLGAGFTGIGMLGIFFLSGILATSWKKSIKEKVGAAEKNKGKRAAGQVLANGGVAGLAGLISWLFPYHREIFQLMMAAALSSAIADTLSSELGTVYGRKFYNILNFQKDKQGDNGVVSLEGTIIGISGSLVIACIYAIGFGWDHRFAWIIIAGTFGNITDSVLGATLERNNYLKNDAINLLNTITASLVAFLLYQIF